MYSIFLGIVNDFNFGQPPKAAAPILVKFILFAPLLTVTFDRDLQKTKAPVSMRLKDEGSLILVRELQ